MKMESAHMLQPQKNLETSAVTEASVGHTFTELTGIERWTALA